ncbi:microtubule-associated protein Jupiter isoform X2 [Drosophila tropicalis]|uniref:microtubule-associated protein Jupiter isoform X2 n=1 Tax=Drosophila tropicalis TaxID=46794 RepID=UPI0035ABDFEF
MAAYAAFKHVELYNVGKAKKRVLRPPGGGSSDIFGADMPATPRTVKNRMISNIFSADKDGAIKNNVRQGAHRFYFIGETPRRGQKSVDSHSRLFGEPSRPITPGKNHMKSSIPFGQNSEAAAAQKLLTNGNTSNTTNGHYNGKSGSVSSASSSVSSSTENLKINSGSRSVFRNMSTGAEKMNKVDDPDCASLMSQGNSGNADPVAQGGDTASIDMPCKSNDVGSVQADNQSHTESRRYGYSSQSRRTAGTSPLNPYSLDKINSASAAFKEPLGPCSDYIKDPQHVPCIKIHAKDEHRNPITGLGLNGDGVGGLKPKKMKIREGNPVTGEGYKSGGSDTAQTPTMNGANQVINKNRIPPGGYSSGLW